MFLIVLVDVPCLVCLTNFIFVATTLTCVINSRLRSYLVLLMNVVKIDDLI